MMQLEEARAWFAKDRFATEATGIRIDEIGVGYARCSLEVEPKHCAAHGGVMGGAIYTLADFAFAVASNIDGRLTVTASGTISYTGRAKDRQLVAVCRCIKDGRTTCLFETRVTDGQGNLVALVTSNGMHLER